MSCLNLVCQTLLTPKGRPHSLRRVVRGWDGAGRREWEKGREGVLELVCRMKKNNKNEGKKANVIIVELSGAY